MNSEHNQVVYLQQQLTGNLFSCEDHKFLKLNRAGNLIGIIRIHKHIH
jgi:hypothetical protein